MFNQKIFASIYACSLLVKHINSTYTITFCSRALEVALHRCICQQSSLRLSEQGKISQQERATGFLLTYPDIGGNATTIGNNDIAPMCLDTVSRPIVMDMYNHVTHSRSTITHARTRVRARSRTHQRTVHGRYRETMRLSCARESERTIALMPSGSSGREISFGEKRGGEIGDRRREVTERVVTNFSNEPARPPLL